MAFRLLSRGSSRRRRRGPRRKSTSMSGFRGSVRLSEAPLITSKMASLSTLPSRSIKLWNEPSVARRSEEHTSELQSLMRISYAVFCLNKKKKNTKIVNTSILTQEITHKHSNLQHNEVQLHQHIMI